MSTGRRLAKRSIIGTRVCAQGPDGLWYSGVIQDVKTPPTANQQSENNNCINLTPETRYTVRFDLKTIQNQMKLNSGNEITTDELTSTSQSNQNTHDSATACYITTTMDQSSEKNINIMETDQNFEQQKQSTQTTPFNQHVSVLINPVQTIRRNALVKEYRETELIGPGFRSIMGVQLLPGQKVFLTHNGRETSGDVISHDFQNDNVVVRINSMGLEESVDLHKRLEEVRLLESRRSARLADQERDTDFARLADMAGDRRRTSHNIDVPMGFSHQQNSRKRRPSYTHDERENFLQFRDENEMEACNAALVLMSLSCSPRSPSINKSLWNTLGSSPGSSSASWSSGSSSPPLSDDGSTLPNLNCANTLNKSSNENENRNRSTSLSTSDEGIVLDYGEETPRKRKAQIIYKCTWKGCNSIEMTVEKIELHVRNVHLGPKKRKQSKNNNETDLTDSEDDHEEEFYYTEIGGDENFDHVKAVSPPSPPTLSHRDMARPPHEDPEYQKQIVGNFRQGLLASMAQPSVNKNSYGPLNIPTSPLAHHNYTWAAQQTPSATTTLANSNISNSPMKHAKWSPRPSTSTAPYHSLPGNQHQHIYNHNSITGINATSNQFNTMNNCITVVGHNVSEIKCNTDAQLSQSAPNPSTFNTSPNIQNQRPILMSNHRQAITITTPHSSKLQSITGHSSSYQNHQLSHPPKINSFSNSTSTIIASVSRSPQSPNRRTRGENKKCRKVYGMDRKDQWCTQCKWKKACSRFGD